MARRLKVFTWSDGFHSHPVAVTSRPKALEAWGVEQDLFKSGLARELTSGPDYEAALATPGVVMRRGEAIDVGQISRARPRANSAPSRAQKAKVRELEARLDALDLAFQQESLTRERAREALDREAQAAQGRYEKARSAARRKLAAAREALGD